MSKQLRSYHFDGGNSTRGPIGFSARVQAYSKKEAAGILAAAIPEEHNIIQDDGSVEYVNVYFNFAKIKAHLIDSYEDMVDDGPAGNADDAADDYVPTNYFGPDGRVKETI
jgi:hypothetical protein